MFKDEYASKKIFSEINILRRFGQMRGNVFTTKILDLILPRLEQGEKFNYLFIVMDNAASDLKKVLSSASQIQFDEHHVLCILYNTLCSLNYLHTANVMHRDIKPANILIEPDCQIRLCDFGLSRPVPDSVIMPSINDNNKFGLNMASHVSHGRFKSDALESLPASPHARDLPTKIEKGRAKRRSMYYNQTPSRINACVSPVNLHTQESPY